MKKCKILIAIPSKDRAKQFYKNSYSFIRHIKSYDYKIFLEPQDIPKYNYLDSSEIIDIKLNDKGLAYSKNKISLYAKKHNYTHIFKFDDDIIRIRHKLNSGKPRAEWVSMDTTGYANLLEGFLKDVEDLINSYSGKYIGVSLPYGKEMYKKLKWLGINMRYQTCYICPIESFSNEFVDQFKFLDDFVSYIDTTKRKHGFVFRYGLIGLEPIEIGANKGGLQSFNRDKQIKQELLLLQSYYPYLKIRTTKKSWKYEPDLSSLKIKSKRFY